MEFDSKAFLKAKIELREDTYLCKPLGPWCKGEPELTIRGLTGTEFAQCLEAKKGNDNAEKLLQALLGPDDGEKTSALKEIFGIDQEFPYEYIKRIQAIVFGVEEPKLSRDVITKLGKYHVMEIYGIGNAIFNLTDTGGLVKPNGSGITPKSEPH